MSRKRILFTGEASYLSTGYSTLAKEIISAFHKDGRYDVAEMGSYGTEHDPRAKALPWKFYGVLPRNEQENQIYQKTKLNEFGVYKIEAILSDFQPDIVFDARDPWMIQHLVNNRFRNNYKLILCPTVDSAPQKQDWVDGIFKKADVLTAYSKFGKRVLEKQGAKVSAITSPGVDLNIFKPMDKFLLREKWCLNNKLLIIGTVMRNQKRKLFPDLFQGYAELRKIYKGVQEVERSVLLCHTSWPDVGWDIPQLLDKYEIGKHVIFTYKCDKCSNVFHSWFLPCDKRGMGRCHKCGENAAHMPNTHNGVTQEELAEIYNLMDIYIQPAICEGWGMPIVEAKACGIPGIYQNYSAMEDHIENGGGLPLNIGHTFIESETMAERTYPSISHMVNQLKILLTNSNERKALGRQARECAEKLHGWPVATNKLISIVEKLPLHDRSTTWNAGPNQKILNMSTPQDNLSNEEFVYWCYKNILGREPDTNGFNDWCASLKNGKSKQAVLEYFRDVVRTDNLIDSSRWKRSLEIRGIKPIQLQFESNNLPGILL